MDSPWDDAGGPPPPPPPPAPRWNPPFISWLLLGGSVALTLATLALPGLTPLTWLQGELVERGEWYRILSTVFIHGGLIHLFFNMSAVYTLGQQLERAVGHGRMAWVSTVSALGSGAFVLLFGYFQPTVGASGVLCGYLGAMLPIATRAGRRWLLTTVVQIAIISLLPFVSWQGHLGGFLFGLAAGALLRLPRGMFLPLALALLAGSGAFTAWSVDQGGRFTPARLAPGP
jgi:rhomboid protease GluP